MSANLSRTLALCKWRKMCGSTLEYVIRRIFIPAFLVLFVVAGCRSSQKPGEQSNSDVTVYHVRGKVVSTDAPHGIVVLDHEAIPGFMEAMTMPYQLKDPSIISDLHPGDVITADVLVSKTGQQTITLDHIVVVAQGKADYKPAVTYHVPAPGDVVPDFSLRNQDGRAIHLAEFKGKTLLVTFIYTRCPLPNFCPLVSHNFATINSELSGNPKLYAKTHLLSISFDPEHDTPAVLRSYGAGYLGSDSKAAFSHWDFAVPSKTELQKMAQYFDVGMSNGADGTITHTLSTTVIGPDGKVVKFYPGNEWTPSQLVDDVKKLEGKTS
jgi:protein SCO1/2